MLYKSPCFISIIQYPKIFALRKEIGRGAHSSVRARTSVNGLTPSSLSFFPSLLPLPSLFFPIFSLFPLFFSLFSPSSLYLGNFIQVLSVSKDRINRNIKIYNKNYHESD